MRYPRRSLPVPALFLFLAGVAGCSSTPPPADPGPPKATSAPAVTAAPAPTPTETASAAVTAAPAPDAPAAPPSKWAACENAPVGMVCVPGGPAIIGSNDHEAREKPQHTVEVSTFYIDRYEVTNKQYVACEDAGVCPKRIMPDKMFLHDDQPAVPVTWFGARAYCNWAGKRLPTEAEWEKAARGGDDRVYPWGNEAATCDRAQTEGCAPNTTKPVGSFAVGPYGIYDMAGNGYEWMNDWASACYGECQESCGAACSGEDPWGPCGGAPVCKGNKMHVLKGGSWRWAATEARGAWRRFEEPGTGAHRLSARCAASTPELATWPPLAISDPPASPGDPAALTDDLLAKFKDVVEDTDINKIPACEKAGGSTTICRDPNSYLTTNEPDLHLWEPFVRNIAGGYVGVGADQNYSLLAAAKSRYAWLFDYDPMVVKLHIVLRAVILASPTPKDFVEAFAPGNYQKTKEIVGNGTPAADKDSALRLLQGSRELLYTDYSKRLAKTTDPARKNYDWLTNAESYRYIRLMYQQGRILPLKGNLLTDKIMPSIGKAARALGTPIRIFYTSNADDQWKMTPQFKANVLGFPFDTRSVWLRTVYPREKQRTKVLPWEYVVQSGLDAQRKIKHDGWDWVWYFNKDAHHVGPENLLAVALPAKTEREKAPSGQASTQAPSGQAPSPAPKAPEPNMTPANPAPATSTPAAPTSTAPATSAAPATSTVPATTPLPASSTPIAAPPKASAPGAP
ncbi:MAG: SUMF1/EgtB/PvdO family nonheme iron enzyme [Polyangiaceae bacterium]